ncbi:BURP domain protein RD22 isoform X2 [Ricinus communis]|uniref:BURP domain protein RD22 isoform X2 n=1 Tax=Ricinus communis TaxID=3988 RepID=UPI00201A9D0A|nr:BURP domain protein RD22 isoform X2 [Ricinus communis]
MATIDFHLLPIFALFCVMVSGSKASLPAEDYWHSQELLKLLHPAVALGGADGTKAKALAVCHLDTSSWNPRYLAFLMLKIKHGEGTICHFIKSNTLVWSSN